MAVIERRIGELPWGWWLRACPGGFEDEAGQLWSSVRDAFWEGELGFPPTPLAPEQHELMLRVLTAIEAGWHRAQEQKQDLFGGDMMFWRFYQCWLTSIGMIDVSKGCALHGPLSAMGRSVVMMLQATRQPEWERVPIAAIMAVIAAERDHDSEARERHLSRFEREVRFRRHLFAREVIGTTRLVTLTGITEGARMPTRCVAWSQSFPDARSRDALFAWMVERVHRWDDWGNLAYEKGADALTAHLLSLIVSAGGLPK